MCLFVLYEPRKGKRPEKNGQANAVLHGWIVPATRASGRNRENVPLQIDDVKALLLDMDGTVYLGPNPIDGAPEFVKYLQDAGIPFLFLTNNPSQDAAYYRDKLARMNIRVECSDILTAGAATAAFLRDETPCRRPFVVGTPSFEQELLRAGMELGSDAPDVVVIAFDKTLTYAKLERACLLLSAGLPYIATNPDRVCPTEYGYIPDCGAIVVTTPQPSAAWVSERAGTMGSMMHQNVIGVIENMSWYETECPHCGKPHRVELFGSGGGQQTADGLTDRLAREVPLLAQIPMELAMGAGSEFTSPVVISQPDLPAAQAITGLAERLVAARPSLVGKPLNLLAR